MTPLLTAEQRATIGRILAPYAAQVSGVAVFGSRATGAARNNSDIDLVIYGDIDGKIEQRLRTLFEESNLPVSVDVVVYNRITHPELKQHIDTVAIPLFSASELRGFIRVP